MHVHSNVRSIHSSDNEQSKREQGQLHPATSSNNKLHAVGDIQILQEGQRLPNYMC